jgi:hypothetical protein
MYQKTALNIEIVMKYASINLSLISFLNSILYNYGKLRENEGVVTAFALSK